MRLDQGFVPFCPRNCPRIPCFFLGSWIAVPSLSPDNTLHESIVTVMSHGLLLSHGLDGKSSSRKTHSDRLEVLPPFCPRIFFECRGSFVGSFLAAPALAIGQQFA